MDAIELLTRDHETVRDLAKRFERAHDADDASEMRAVAEKICDELDVHAAIEEEIFYPAVRELGEDEITELVAEGVEEHHVVKVLVREIRSLAETSDEKLAAKTTVLIENVEHHADEEELEMFPKVRSAMDEAQLADLGTRLRDAKSSKQS